MELFKSARTATKAPRGRLVTIALSAALLALPLCPSSSQGAEAGKIGGSGSGIGALRLLAGKFAARTDGFSFQVLPSLGSTGGIRAVIDKAIEIAVSARPLSETERANGAREQLCIETAYVLVTSRDNPPPLRSDEIAAYFRETAPSWPDGASARIVLRPKDESSSGYLAENFKEMREALDVARKRIEAHIAASDQENAELAERLDGSLAVMTLLQLVSEKARLRAIALDGVEPTVENLQNGRYPHKARICLVTAGEPIPAARAFLDFISLSEGAQILRQSGGLLVPSTKQ